MSSVNLKARSGNRVIVKFDGISLLSRRMTALNCASTSVARLHLAMLKCRSMPFWYRMHSSMR